MSSKMILMGEIMQEALTKCEEIITEASIEKE
jgi:hypothetical protein